MTDAELLLELVRQRALIVHCSRPGKGDEGIDGLLFPDDLRNAINICANQGKELCCSVIWPDHIELFGAVGIVLKPRGVASITSICTTDGGTSLNPKTGKREGNGLPFSRQGFEETFSQAVGYNEWNVENADTIGLFVHPREPWDVAKKVRMSEIPGYDSAIRDEETVGLVTLKLDELAAYFPGLPIYTFQGANIVRLGSTEPVRVDASELYG